MNLNKKVIESMTVASTLLVMTTITALGGSTEDGTGDVTRSVALSKNGTAGVMVELRNLSAVSLNSGDLTLASIEKPSQDIVSESGEDISVETGSVGGVAELGEFAAEEILRNTETAAEDALENTSSAAEVAVEPAKEMISDAAGESLAEEMLADAAEENYADEMLADTAEKSLAEERPSDAASESFTEEKADCSEELEETAEQPEQQGQPEEMAEQPVQLEETQQSDEIEPETEETEWSNLVMADVEEDMNIRTAPDENSELAGKFYRGDVAEVVSIEGEWTQITSGNAAGYVKNDYLVYGEEANALANEVCSLYATVEADGLRLRSEPSEEAGVVTTAADGDRLKVDKEAEAADGWVAVYTADSTAYVSADYVSVALNLGTALNSEEVAAKEEREAAEARAAAAAKSAGTKKAAVAAGADEVALLGALIQCEAGGSSYEGMVAVGAVVMNRVRSGGYPGSISGVVYQGGQFTPALNGSVARVLASGVRGACLSAAQEAINGRDNTNGALSFRGVSSGAQGTVIGGNVFF